MDVFKKSKDQKFFNVRKFIEKPDLKNAQQLIESKNVFWNAGSFMAYPDTVLDALDKFAPDILNHVVKAFKAGKRSGSSLLLDHDWMEKCRSESIDYAVMEKHENVRMIPLTSGWSDIGSWNALADLFEPDDNGNKANGKAHFIDAKNTFVYSMGREVVAVGTKDIFVVETPDAILVSNISSAEKIKAVVKILEKAEITILTVSLRLKYNFPDKSLARYLLIAPTGFAIDMSLSLRTTISFDFNAPALFIAS